MLLLGAKLMERNLRVPGGETQNNKPPALAPPGPFPSALPLPRRLGSLQALKPLEAASSPQGPLLPLPTGPQVLSPGCQRAKAALRSQGSESELSLSPSGSPLSPRLTAPRVLENTSLIYARSSPLTSGRENMSP